MYDTFVSLGPNYYGDWSLGLIVPLYKNSTTPKVNNAHGNNANIALVIYNRA